MHTNDKNYETVIEPEKIRLPTEDLAREKTAATELNGWCNHDLNLWGSREDIHHADAVPSLEQTSGSDDTPYT